MARIKYKEALGLGIRREKPPIGNKPSKSVLRRLYIRESKSIREIANLLGCTKDMVYRALGEYEIKRRERSKTKESVLSSYPLSHLVTILGAGLVGGPMARDLAADKEVKVTAVDVSSQALDRLKRFRRIKTVREDLANPKSIKNVIRDADLVISAVPGFMGFKTLQAVLESGKTAAKIAAIQMSLRRTKSRSIPRPFARHFEITTAFQAS